MQPSVSRPLCVPLIDDDEPQLHTGYVKTTVPNLSPEVGSGPLGPERLGGNVRDL